jgi:hypothetical protein
VPPVSDNVVGHSFHLLRGVTHVVTGRLGGVSPIPLDSLNVSFAVGDDAANVVENRARAFRVLGADLEDGVFARQVHGTRVETVSAADRRRGADGSLPPLPDADGLVTDCANVWLALSFADCVPILLYDPVRGAVGLAHGGWRGTLAGVARSAVVAMRQAFGTVPSDLLAGIGPSIGPCCYEVGPEVVSAAKASLPEAALCLSRPSKLGNPERAHLDLWNANRSVLIAAGLRAESIETAGICTCCSRDRFFSHRGDHGQSGRFGAIIGLTERA